ncbi:MAG TPA: amidohydrolase family protein [Stellaceae bacterium]|nr:amidohydrolase family protein [Stellaceae bacterium]
MRGLGAFLTALCCMGIAIGNDAYAAECPPSPAPYAGPIFDANVQAWNLDLDGLIPSLAAAGVKRIALFANSKAGGTETVDAVEAAARDHPGLITLGAPKIGFIKGGDLPGDFVSETLSGIASGRYRFIGEILYTHGDKPDHPPTRMGEVYVDPLAAGTSRLLAGLKGRDVPLLTHWEAWAWERDRPRFDRLYASWPAQRFVLPSLAYGSPDKADAILSAHPNVSGIISRLVDGRYKLVDPAKQAKLGPPMTDACGVLLPEWRTVLIKYGDRLMYGSDDYATTRVGWGAYPAIVATYRRVAGQLPPDLARKISWDNAAALYRSR